MNEKYHSHFAELYRDKVWGDKQECMYIANKYVNKYIVYSCQQKQKADHGHQHPQQDLQISIWV